MLRFPKIASLGALWLLLAACRPAADPDSGLGGGQADEQPGPKMAAPQSGWYALRYGRSAFPHSFVVASNKTQNKPAQPEASPPKVGLAPITLKPGQIPFAWYIYFLHRQDRRIVIDSGLCSPAAVQSFAIKDYVPPPDLLGRLGIRPEEVTDVILTHGHVDHAGCLSQFSRATVYTTQAELIRFAQRPWYPKRFMNSLRAQNRLVLVPPQAGPNKPWQSRRLPGLGLWSSGGHTAGSLVVVDHHKGALKIFTGDECYLGRYCRAPYHLPAVAAHSLEANRRFIHWVDQKSGGPNPAAILTGHDPNVVSGRVDLGGGVFYLEDP